MQCPAREKQALPRPAPQKLTKPVGRNGTQMTVDYVDYAHKFRLKGGREGKTFQLMFCTARDYIFAERPSKS